MAHVYVRSGAGGAGTGADWANAYLTLVAALAAKAAGDNFWLAGDHSEATASSIILASPGTAANPCTIRCVNHAGSVPPVSADLTTGALVVSTGASSVMTFTGYANTEGVEYRQGTGGQNVTITMPGGSGAGFWTFGPGTKVTFANTGTGLIAVGTSQAGVAQGCEWNGVVFKAGAVGHNIRPRNSRFTWKGGSVDAAGAIPTNLLANDASAGLASHILLEAVDLSALGSGKTIVQGQAQIADVHLKDCKLDAAVTVAGTPVTPGSGRVLVSRTSATGITYGTRQYLYTGTEIAGIDVVRTGGSAAAHKIDTTANAKFIYPYRGIPLSVWNAVTGSNITATMEGIANKATLPNNDEVWFDLEYLGTASFPLGVTKSGAKADILASAAALTASTEAWDTGATARANTTAYVVGDVIKVASNSGRVFFCTTAGTTAGSEPGGYASAVDGGSVTDNTAVFRAGMRFKQAIVTTAAPTFAGFVYVYPKLGIASTTVYLDRKVGLS